MRIETTLRGSKVLVGLVIASSAAACGGSPEPGLARGKALFDTCVPCHGADGGGNQVLAAPSIAGLPQWYIERQLRKFQAGYRGGSPLDTTGIRMKSMSLSLDLAGDVESVAEYVASMPRPEPDDVLDGNAQAGQATYQTCGACHGADGNGIEALQAPPLLGQSDWYMVAQLEKFKAGWRGSHPADTFGAIMRPNAMPLDEASMQNVSSYIESLR
jgi:cytochrome c oxidase subunit 2